MLLPPRGATVRPVLIAGRGLGLGLVRRRWLAVAAPQPAPVDPPSESPAKAAKVPPPPPKPRPAVPEEAEEGEWRSLFSKDMPLINVPPPEIVPIARLHHNLERVLFEPGVHTLRNPNTNQFNFDPYLHKIPPPSKIDMAKLHSFTPPSKDASLVQLAKSGKHRFAGSTSSLGPTLAHLYFLVSRFRGVTPRNVSHAFQKESRNFTQASRQPAITTLTDAGGVIMVDATKLESSYNILSDLGTVLEKIFTSPKGALDEFMLPAKPDNPAPPAPLLPRKPEAYRYSKVGDILVRSQLDCFHPNLARKVFDLKTRATVAVRLDVSNYKDYVGYKLTKYRGLFSSYEREYYDMIRSAFLKYSFQVRLGRMDGIMVAYHNTDEIFGFQYIPLSEMDICVFGNSVMGRAAFSLTTQLLNIVLAEVSKVPSTTPRGMLVHTHMRLKVMDIYVVANAPDITAFFNDISGQCTENVRLYKFRISTRSKINGEETQTPYVEKPSDSWELSYNLRQVDVASPFRQEHVKTELKQFIQKLTKRSPLAEGYKRLIRGQFVPPEQEEVTATAVDVSKPFEGPTLTKVVRRFRPFFRDRRVVHMRAKAEAAAAKAEQEKSAQDKAAPVQEAQPNQQQKQQPQEHRHAHKHQHKQEFKPEPKQERKAESKSDSQKPAPPKKA